MELTQRIRRGCKDIWNASLLVNATYSENDIPFCPTTANDAPKSIITYEEALIIHRKRIIEDKSYHIDDFVIFAIDDYKFDKGINSIWDHPMRAIELLKHFGGIITPDYSTYMDFPEPIKFFNTFRMRAFGFIAGEHGIKVINNVRWDPSNNYAYCFDGIAKNEIVLIGTVASQLRIKENRHQFEEGFNRLLQALEPRMILVYGSAKYSFFERVKRQGIPIIEYKSRLARFFEARKKQ